MDFLTFYEKHQESMNAALDLIGNIGGPVGLGIAALKMGLSHGVDKRRNKSQLSESETEKLRAFQETLQPRLEKLVENLEQNQDFKNATTEEERVAIVKNNNALSNEVEEMQEIVHKTMTVHAKDLVLFGEDFQILSKLGRGGEGEVVCAYHRVSGKTVALKIFPSGLSQSAIESLKRRYNLVSRLRHSNIVQYLNLSYEPSKDQYYFVMDYIAGCTLENKIQERKVFSIYDTIRLLLPIAQALDFTHEKNIIHRDLKPANILLQEPNGVYLADFGLATEVKASLAELTGNTLLKVGTMAYMAPEQYYQDPFNHPLSFYTDNWAFGVIAYEMLEGKLPFNGGIDWRCFKSLVCEEEVPTPEKLSKECWEALKPCFEHDPKKRPQSVVSVLFNLFEASDCEQKEVISKWFGSYESYRLKEQVHELTTRVEELETDKKHLTETMQGNQAENEALKKEITSWQAQVGAYAVQAQTKEAETKRLTQELQELKANAEKYNKIKEESQQKEAKLAELEKKLEMQGSNYDNAMEIVKTRDNEVNELKSQVVKLSSMRLELEEKVQKRDHGFSEVTEQLKLTEKEKKTLLEQVSNAEKQAEKWKKQAETQQATNEALHNQIELLKNQIATQQKVSENLQQKVQQKLQSLKSSTGNSNAIDALSKSLYNNKTTNAYFSKPKNRRIGWFLIILCSIFALGTAFIIYGIFTYPGPMSYKERWDIASNWLMICLSCILVNLFLYKQMKNAKKVQKTTEQQIEEQDK